MRHYWMQQECTHIDRKVIKMLEWYVERIEEIYIDGELVTRRRFCNKYGWWDISKLNDSTYPELKLFDTDKAAYDFILYEQTDNYYDNPDLVHYNFIIHKLKEV